MSLRIQAANLASIKDRQLFFDTNILMYLFGGVAYPSWAVNTYSKVFKECLILEYELCVDAFVLSEFINRSLRIEYENYLKNKGLDRNSVKFKNFRSTDDGMQVAEDIEMVVKDTILRHFTLIGKLFSHADICSIDLANKDFNDELIIQTCKEHGCVLVTNDKDFSGADIDILTANRHLV